MALKKLKEDGLNNKSLNLTQSKLIDLKDKSMFIFTEVSITLRVIGKIDKLIDRKSLIKDLYTAIKQYDLIPIYEIFPITLSK